MRQLSNTLLVAAAMLLLVACGEDSQPPVDIDATVEARVQAVAKVTALSIPTVTPVPTVAPITTATPKPVPPTVTPAADELEEDVTCTLKAGEVVQKGWSGKDTGSNSCNQCRCLSAGLACTKVACPSVKSPATPAPVPPTTAPAPLSEGTSTPVPTATPTPTPTLIPTPTIQRQAQTPVFYQQNGLTLEYHWPLDDLNHLSAEETQILAYNESDEAIEFIMPQMSFTENGSPRAITSGTWEKFPSRYSWDRIEQIFLLSSYQGEPLIVQPGEKAKIHWHLERITSTDTNQSVALDLTVTTGARTETITLTLVRHSEQSNTDVATAPAPTQERDETH